ncbi:MAG: T9SS type A sorting domain-containing protein, partial [Saprospiraceae bacterium]|nr:T9SS type A sorting domain-containing protein [Saprospiraceae bacterium]
EFTNKVNPLCIGAKNGSIELVITGGQPPFKFNWNNGGNTAKIQNLGVGAYKATITDAQNCILVTSSILLTAPQLLSVALDTLIPVACRGGQTGLISVSVGGSVGAVSASWNGIPDDLTLSSAAAGFYVLKAEDARACSILDTFQITEPEAALQVVALEVKNALCAGEPTGSVSVRVTGGTPPYQYNWSNGASSTSLPSVPAGMYGLTVTDSKGCTQIMAPVTVGEPPALTASATITDIPCFGPTTGSIQLSIGGGVGPYHYMWNTGDTTKNLFTLAAGGYEVTVLDATGCAQVLSELIVTDRAVNFQLEPLLIKPVSCSGQKDGQIAVQVFNGTAPYQFSWSAPVGLHPNINLPRDTALGLTGGDYRVTVTDAAGCTAVSPVFNIEEAPPLQLNISQISHIICKGDSTGVISVQVSGGVPPYNYLWSNGASQPQIQQLPAGVYQLTVTDVRACTLVSAPAEVHEPPTAINIVLNSITHDKCGVQKGAISLQISGGISPYQYSWSNGAGTASISSLPAGMYQLTVTDNQGCSRVSPVYEVTQGAAPLLLADTVLTQVLCRGDSTGAIQPAISGGTPAYQYFWSNGASGPALQQVPAGNYVLTVSDAAGCTALYHFSLTQPTQKLAATWSADSSAGAWSVTLSPTGGVPGYDIRWDAQTGNQMGPVAGGLEPGLYRVTVTDANGCQLALSIPVGTFTGVDSPLWTAELLLAPNPSAGRSEVHIQVSRPEAVRVRVFDVAGRLVLENEHPEKEQAHRFEFDLSDQPAGLYWVSLRFSNGQGRTLRWVIHSK